ncbi:hypothetical protein EYD45_11590 [Hyunsoonleella flava]|uniref:Uncharacterized protein n=1 Tax=Hyunsoonleella flava TaxID=2527939 RepID=A0A4Q9FEY8_9FLAO|nr:hypothetical protein [Hyunsoonleella flava]TBN02348.1 hypothetical protein EYD45_11590 [Hyunsoonleella flava]
MKNLVTMLFLICVCSISAQTKMDEEVSKTIVKFENLDISVTVNSLDDIKSTLDVNDIKAILADVDDNESLSFAMTCKDETEGSNGYVTYKVKGDTDDIDSFIKSVKVIKKSAIKYYKNKV